MPTINVSRILEKQSMNKPSMALPPDVARERQMQAQQQNQLYSTAFQIYLAILPNALESDDETVEQMAIARARRFKAAVEEDMKRGNS